MGRKVFTIVIYELGDWQKAYLYSLVFSRISLKVVLNDIVKGFALTVGLRVEGR